MSFVPSDGIKREPDMDSMGWPCSILLHGQILPFRVMFHALTRYMLLCLWAALSASRKILHPSDEIMWHSSRKTSMIAIVLWVQVVIGQTKVASPRSNWDQNMKVVNFFPWNMGMLLLTKVIAKTIGPLNDITMACPTPKKFPFLPP